jgi:hypothetical protein
MKLSSAKHAALFVALAVLTPGHCPAFPIQPVTLRQLIENSDLIVFAKVEAAPAKPDKKDVILVWRHRQSPARLRPISVLKGTAPTGLIEVHFDPNLVCPSPPSFPEGSNVMAFLQRNVGSNGFHTVSLSYGAVSVSPEEARAYTSHIEDYLSITREADGEGKSRHVTEWLVKCVEDPVTRWEGAADLCGRQWLSTQRRKSEFADYLTGPQIARLSNVLFNAKFVGSGELALMDIFKTTAKPQLVKFVIRYLRTAAQPAPRGNKVGPDRDDFAEPWNVYDVMVLAAELVDSEQARAIVKESVRTDFFEASERMSRVRKFLPVLEQAASKAGYR